jgi:hypothetical protein
MKQTFMVLAAISSVVVFSYCSGTKKAVAETKPVAPTITYTYEANVQQLVAQKCSPCHIPAKGGRKLALDTYDAVKGNIDDIIRRISLSPDQPGFMPFKNPKLSDSAILVFKTWKNEGFTK